MNFNKISYKRKIKFQIERERKHELAQTISGPQQKGERERIGREREREKRNIYKFNNLSAFLGEGEKENKKELIRIKGKKQCFQKINMKEKERKREIEKY